MPLFKKKDDHPGSGLDKPPARGLIDKVVDKVKGVGKPEPVMPPKGPVAP